MNVTIPPTRSGTFSISESDIFTIEDDRINEDVQSFAIIAEIGPDVPFNCYVRGVGLSDCSCFQLQEGVLDCLGRRGAAEIRILDNDGILYSYVGHILTFCLSLSPRVSLSLSLSLQK